MRLKNKVSIITGAASGIGEETAYLFAQEGASVVVADIDGAKGDQVAQKIREEGGRSFFVETDVSKAKDVRGMIDTAIGHFRRYNRDDFLKLTPSTLKVVKVFYLDSIGFLVSLINKFILRSSMPTQKQINIWDRIIIPISRIIDPCICYSIGRSIGGIWRKT